MKLHKLRSQVKALSGRRPASDPDDVARIYAMLEPLAGLIGCGEPTPGPEDEKKGDDAPVG